MKDITFLKENLICRRGVYDNKRIYENTIAAYNRAVKHKYLIELDVRMLNDGTLICFHDEDMVRLLHVEGNIEKLNYEELSFLAKYQIPTLEDALNAINGAVPILIQIKTKSKKNNVELALVKLLDKYNGKFAIESFDPKGLKWFYKNKPDYVTGYMVGWKNFRRELIFKRYDFMNIKIDSYNPTKIKRYKEKKLVIGWRITTKEEFEINKTIYDNLVCDNILEIIGE